MTDHQMNSLGGFSPKFENHAPRDPWKKLLYLKQDYPDNYTSDSFLSQLKRNTTVSKYPYNQLFSIFSLIVLHLSNLMMVIVVFYGLYNLHWNPIIPVTVSTLLTIPAFITNHKINIKAINVLGNSSATKSPLLIIFILLVLSPVLKSLTKSTSSDSIWALSCWLCVVNIIFHDYAVDLNRAYRPILSTNLAVSNTIVLASRLNSNVSVFCFVLFAIQVNMLLPMFDFSIRKYQPKYHQALLATVVTTVYVFVGFIWGFFYLFAWVSLHFGICVLGPFYFLALQKYKNELQGPWDPAKPIINTI